jgi:hypothetical protein
MRGAVAAAGCVGLADAVAERRASTASDGPHDAQAIVRAIAIHTDLAVNI